MYRLGIRLKVCTILALVILSQLSDGRSVAAGSSTSNLPAAASDTPVVSVANVEALYAEVDDPANAGAHIVLSAGNYPLSASEPDGTPRPNRGRLELQENMSISGVFGDRSEVVIDAVGLPVSSYQGGGPPLTGAIRIGRGHNSIEWLTIKNATVGSAGIETDLIFPGTAYVRIAHIASTGNARGLDVRNFGPASSGSEIEAEIIDNDFFDNTFSQSQGIRIGNIQGTSGSTINATVLRNRSYRNQIGMLMANFQADNNVINVRSSANRFYENGSGAIILGGLSSLMVTANGNSILFEGFGDRFENNQAFSQVDRGGLLIFGGENISIPNGTSNNTVNVQLSGCIFANNQLWDLGAIGARSVPESLGLPGTNNKVTVELKGMGSPSFVEFYGDCVPEEVAGTNTVTVVGGKRPHGPVWRPIFDWLRTDENR
jgi:hypothetical protein